MCIYIWKHVLPIIVIMALCTFYVRLHAARIQKPKGCSTRIPLLK